jgi:predicted CoA-binding protein
MNMKTDFIEMEIAVIGVSENEEKYGHKIFRDLLNAGYKVVGVNPKGGMVLEKEIYRSIEEIPHKIDLLILVVPPAVTEEIVEISKKLGIKSIWMQPGSESEVAIKKAKEYGIHITFNKCFMKENGLW